MVSAGVAVGVPIVIILITIAVVVGLVIAFLYYRSRQKHKDSLDSKGDYAPIPLQEDSGSAPTPKLPAKSLPYGFPPKISLADPPTPPMAFTMATQLTDTSKTGGLRYPFMEAHKHPEGRPLRDTRPPKQRTKKKGNHKHGNGRHVVLKSSGSIDTSSDVSDHSSSSGVRSEVRPRAKQSPLAASPSPSEPDEPVPTAEIYFTLKFNEESQVFVVGIERCMSLPPRQEGDPVDAYIRLFLIPKLANLPQRKTAKTKTQIKELSPVFNEDIRYENVSKEELINCTLHLEVLDYRAQGKHALMGTAAVNLLNVTFVEGEAAMKLTLTPPEVRESLGTVNLSICYSPDTKRLSVIILRAKDLNRGNFKETDAQAKLWVSMSGEKFLGKLRTRKKQQSSAPIFNEALTCTVEPSKISGVAISVALTNEHRQASTRALGQVTLCAQSSGEEFRHWSDVMATPGKHIAEWHELR